MKPSASFGLVPYWTTGQVAVQAKGKGVKKRQIWSTSKSMGASFEESIHVCNHVVPCLSNKMCCLPICSSSVVYWYFFSAMSSQISKDILFCLNICWILFGKISNPIHTWGGEAYGEPWAELFSNFKVGWRFPEEPVLMFWQMACVTFRLQSKHWNLRGKCAATNLGTHVDAFIKLKGTGIIVCHLCKDTMRLLISWRVLLGSCVSGVRNGSMVASAWPCIYMSVWHVTSVKKQPQSEKLACTAGACCKLSRCLQMIYPPMLCWICHHLGIYFYECSWGHCLFSDARVRIWRWRCNGNWNWIQLWTCHQFLAESWM